MRTLFFGSSDFGAHSLNVLAQRTQLCGVVTQPDRPAGRGKRLRPTPIKIAAHALGVPVYEPQALRAFAAEQSSSHYDLFVVASYGKILPQTLLDVPVLGALNVHPSLLPKYRGATPIQSALRAGENETGVTIILMDAGMDTGEVVLQERTPIAPQERYGELHDRLALFGAQALAHAIDFAKSGHIPHAPQTGTPSITHPIAAADLLIDWRVPRGSIVNQVRAFSPSPAARAIVQGVQVKVLRARMGARATAASAPGDIVGIGSGTVRISCGDGTVELEEVVPPSRGSQSGEAFARSLSASAR